MYEPTGLSRWRHAAELTGRRPECRVLDQLIRSVRSGQSQALVVSGEPGIGKTALLDYVAVQALGCQVMRAGGVQSEIELPFAALHQLCTPMLDRVDHLPAPQREALRTVFGISSGSRPDRFMVGLAALSLLSEVAADRPLVCLIDDHQWLDRESAQSLTFVARRLGAESLGLIFGTRTVGEDLAGVPELPVAGLRDADARALLDAALTGPLDERVRDQLVAETRGNPLALLELPHGLTAAELAGGFGLPTPVALAGSIEDSFARRAATLPAATRLLLLIGAADPSGNAPLVWQAAGRLAIDTSAAAAAAEANLAEFGARVLFRHPLVRSAIYRSASPQQRRRVHDALAWATDPLLDPDRRAWHRAHAAAGPDEPVAAELIRSADRARARGGLAAAAAFLERAATLTVDPASRTERALAAAQAKIQAGGLDAANRLLGIAEQGSVTRLRLAHLDLVRAQLAFVANHGRDAPPLMLKAARELETVDVELARATYLEALSAAVFAGRLAGAESDVLTVARAAAKAPPAPSPHAADLLLDGTAASYNEGYAAGLPLLRAALDGLGGDAPVGGKLHLLYIACFTALRLWEEDQWEKVTSRYLHLVRSSGALGELPLALTAQSYKLMFAGDLAAAASLVDEIQTITDAAASNLAPYAALGLAAFLGDESRTAALVEATTEDVTRRGEGVGITFAEWANALLHNGFGRYDRALESAERATAFHQDRGSQVWSLVELVEAAARSGATETASRGYGWLAEMTSASGTAWALGLQARSQALLLDGDAAEHLYRDAITHLGRTRQRVDLARAHLLYGEWLRRQRRNAEARVQLETAHNMLEPIGVAAFAERAARELRAAGGATRKRPAPIKSGDLTPQEAQIARMARDGLSNPEIATRLFISARTVQYHLRKVFTKLGIASRTQLDRVLGET